MLREARAAAALDHPNVVAIYDVGQVADHEELRGTTYLAMELIKGRSLRAYVGDARVTMKERVSWLADIGHALAAAHAAGIVHRDVKPENVMIRDDGRVKVLDFGIAKSQAVASHTEPGALKGKYVYMSPEMVAGRPIDRRADLFAAGVMLYELITGRLPFVGNSVRAVLSSIALARPIPPRNLDPSIPPDLEFLALRLLQRNPDDRPQTGAEVKETLDGFLEGQTFVVGAGQVAQYMADLFPKTRTGEFRGPGPVSQLMSRPRASLAPIKAKARWVLRGLAVAAIAVVVAAAVLAVIRTKPWRRFASGASAKAQKGPAEASATPLAAGRQALKDGKLDAARQDVEQWVKQQPKDEAGHLLLGQILWQQHFGQKAEQELLAAAQLNPKDPEPWRALGQLKTSEADVAAAVTALQKAQALAPGDVGTDLALAKLYGLRGDWKSEIQMLDAAYHRVGEQPELLAEAGFARYQLNDDAKADDDLKRALKLRPNLPRALYVLGFVRYRQGKIPEAEAAYRAAATADPKSTDALLALADLYKAENQAAKAADVYKEVLVRDPKAQLPK